MVRALEKLQLKEQIKDAAEELEYLLLEYMDKYEMEYLDKKVFHELFTPLVELQIDEIF